MNKDYGFLLENDSHEFFADISISNINVVQHQGTKISMMGKQQHQQGKAYEQSISPISSYLSNSDTGGRFHFYLRFAWLPELENILWQGGVQPPPPRGTPQGVIGVRMGRAEVKREKGMQGLGRHGTIVRRVAGTGQLYAG